MVVRRCVEKVNSISSLKHLSLNIYVVDYDADGYVLDVNGNY